MPIYTKKGDKGTTSTLRSKRKIPKSSVLIEAIGSVDELNSFIGIIVSETKNKKLRKNLLSVQNNLLKIGSIIAGSNLNLRLSETKRLEAQIDQTTLKLPKLQNFIFPGGSCVGAKLHLARSISRRAERTTIKASKSNKFPPNILIYLNRLSDYFFTLARAENHRTKTKEDIWKQK